MRESQESQKTRESQESQNPQGTQPKIGRIPALIAAVAIVGVAIGAAAGLLTLMLYGVEHLALGYCDDTGQITLPLESALDLIQSIQLDLDCYQTIRNELQTGRNQSIYQDRAKVSRIFELFKQVVITEQKRNPHRNIILSALFRKTMNIWLQINRNERGHSIWP